MLYTPWSITERQQQEQVTINFSWFRLPHSPGSMAAVCLPSSRHKHCSPECPDKKIEDYCSCSLGLQPLSFTTRELEFAVHIPACGSQQAEMYKTVLYHIAYVLVKKFTKINHTPLTRGTTEPSVQTGFCRPSGKQQQLETWHAISRGI